MQFSELLKNVFFFFIMGFSFLDSVLYLVILHIQTVKVRPCSLVHDQLCQYIEFLGYSHSLQVLELV